MDIDKIVIENITKLISQRGMSQRELAKQAKINYQNLNRLMRGHRSIIKSDVLAEIATFLGVPVSDLYANPNSETPIQESGNPEMALLIKIQTILPTLNHSELKGVLSFLNSAVSARPSTATTKDTTKAK